MIIKLKFDNDPDWQITKAMKENGYNEICMLPKEMVIKINPKFVEIESEDEVSIYCNMGSIVTEV